MDSVQVLASQVRAVGLSSAIRQRMDATLLADRPFHQLAYSAIRLGEADAARDHGERLQQAQYLRALLDTCRRAAASVREHLDEDLFELGFLDSMAAIELLVGLEDELGVSIAPTEVERSEMNTVNKIVAQVVKRL